MITRRSMLLGVGAALTTPAIVRAESLMRVVVPKPHLITLDEFASRILDPLMAIAENGYLTINRSTPDYQAWLTDAR